MRLLAVRVQNFKLLNDVSLTFSTDRAKPLTVIRAENGSGKTSMLYALSWAFYGQDGLPDEARTSRLLATTCPAGVPVEIKVTVDFEHTDPDGIRSRYRLIRTAMETPGMGDAVTRVPHPPRLLRIDPGKGEKHVDESLIDRFLPRTLQSIFFTDGDHVEKFITSTTTSQQQAQVHGAIRSLLSLDRLRQLAKDLDAISSAARKAAAKAEGADVESKLAAYERATVEVGRVQGEIEAKTEQLTVMTKQREDWNGELQDLRGLGDLEKINAQLAEADREHKRLQQEIITTRRTLRDLVSETHFSWMMGHSVYEEGLKALEGLSDQGIIPGTSLHVLQNRIELKQCICGETLDMADPEGKRRAEFMQNLLAQQQALSESSQRLTAIYHTANHEVGRIKAEIAEGNGFHARQGKHLETLTNLRELLLAVAARRERLSEDREKIDDERVKLLTSRLKKLDGQIRAIELDLPSLQSSLDVWQKQAEDFDRAYRLAKDKASKGDQTAMRRDIADDLRALVSNTLARLESEYVSKVAERTSAMFLKIVGANPSEEGNVFIGVRIDPTTYDIVVDAQGGKTLNHAFEINGASQRALTLAFIWALMEVSGTEAPRIIDTPLGMVAGGVKTRLINAMTDSPGEDHPDFQVVLFLTRSEIRDIEETLDRRASVVTTLSCSKDFPTDLRFDWGISSPVIRACSCSHRQSCRVCARKYDSDNGVVFRDAFEVSNAAV
ncbi:AAA family ATPase [Micromonospora palomenae]|uniref:AAA family ATPase n=1 Tax=Micromonospora palomenae TaxID=1461247 RepID=UPI003F8922E3